MFFLRRNRLIVELFTYFFNGLTYPKCWLMASAVVASLLWFCPPALAQSAVDRFNPNANNNVYAVAVQSDGKILVGGSFTALGGVTRNRIGRLNADGSLDTSFNLTNGANSDVGALAVQADGKILVGGVFTTLGGQTRNRIGRLNTDGSLDTSFNPTNGANNPVFALAVQADGKILVGGLFTTLGGVTRNRIGRLNADGSLDSTFNPNIGGTPVGFALAVGSLAVQADGKILVGGDFSTVGATTRNRIARLNANGSLDTFNPGANNNVQALAVQADGKIVVGGTFTTLGGSTRNRIGRLNTNGSLDTSFNPGVTGQVNELAVQADGKILVGGGFTILGGSTRNNLGRLNTSGSLDTTFNPGAGGTGFDSVNTLGVQADGKIVLGGSFITLGGQTRNRIGRLYPGGELDDTFSINNLIGSISTMVLQPDGKIVVGGDFTGLDGVVRNHYARLNADGTVDPSFDPNAGGAVTPPFDYKAIAVQADGKILLGGAFTTLGGQTHNHIGRVNSDGSPDTTFNPSADNVVEALAVQADGKILVVGQFTLLNGQTRNGIGRLNANGSLDTTFNPTVNNSVLALTVQTDGKIVVAGDFTSLNGQTRNRIGRLNADGTLDTTFNPSGGANFSVFTLAVQSDSKIVVGGYFTTLNGQTRNSIGRLNADGSLDTTYIPDGIPHNGTDFVNTLAVQTDGRIVVGGIFTTLGGVTRNNIGRLNADGTLDTTFNPGAAFIVLALAVQADGKILVGGINTLGGQSRPGLGRLTNTDVAFQNLSVTPNSITWQRSGSSPEIQRVTFELSTDATTFTLLAAGSRIAGGWQLTGLGLPVNQNLFIRARGFFNSSSGGQLGGSESVVESVRNVFLTCSTSTAALSGGGTVCSGVSSTIAVTVTGGASPYSIVINNGVGTVNVPNNNPFNVSVSPTSTTTYTITSGTDASGCTVTPSGSATVTVNPLPTAFTVTGGGSFCAGGSGVGVGLSGSQTGVNYQLLRGVTPVGSPVAGTGGSLNFGNQTTAGSYTVTATNTTTSCTNTMTGSATVTVNPALTAFTVTGGGGYCTGGSGVAVGLSSSQTGVNYQLLRGATPVGSPVAGTGGSLNFGNQTTAGTYTVTATNTTTSCTNTMTGSATVTVNPLPTAFTVTGGSGVAVGLSGSQTGVNYQLLRGATPVGSPVAGTGSVLSFGNQTTAGTYTVTAANTTTSCTNTMTGSATVTVNPLPTAFTVTGGGAFCSGGSGVAVGLSGSQTGVNYQLLRGATPVGSPVAGTGGSLSFGNQTVAGTYTVTASASGCNATMTGNAVVTVNPSPTAFTVTGGGGYCTGGSGVPVGLSGSEVGVDYLLFRDGTSVGTSVAGTGSALAFGNQTMGGTYSVEATNATTGCIAMMNGTPMVTVNPVLTAFTVTGGGSFCAGGSGVGVGLSGSQTGVNYQLLRGATPVGSLVAGTGGTLSFGNQTTAGTYTVTASGGGCNATMTGSALVMINPLPTAFTVTGGGSFCAGGSGVAVGLSGSQTGVNYQLLRGATPVGSPVVGTGSVLSFGNQTTAGTYTVTASASGCSATMTGNVTVTVRPLATVNAGPNQTLCNTSSTVTLAAVLGGSATSGTWTGGAGVFTPDSTAPNATYTPTSGEITAGSVTLTYNPVGTCPGVSDSVTIAFEFCNSIGLMVADTTNNRIQGFDGTDWFVVGGGTVGSGDGQFRLPEGVTFDSNDRIYVADTGNNRIQWTTDGGTTWGDFATNGTGLNQVNAPQGVALDSAGNLYVSDTGNGRVLRFNGGIPGTGVVIASNGTASGQVRSPRGLAIDSTFRLFVTDESNSRILRISNANTTVSATSGAVTATLGIALNKVKNPQGITIDGNGDLYVADTGNNRILKWRNATPTIANSSAMALTGSGLGQVNGAEGVTVTLFSSGPYTGGPILIVGDTGNNRIEGRFIPTGSWVLIGAPNGTGTGIGQFRAPSKIQ